MGFSGDYRQFLKDRWAERCHANPRYSLRAFARDLQIAPSRLSLILQNRQGLSETYARKIAKRLGLNKEETSHFVKLVLASDARGREQRLRVADELKRALDNGPSLLQIDAFKIISDWYHFAILELTKLKGFKNDSTWIARRLGISKIEAESAVARLKRIELLEVKGDRFVATNTRITTSHPDHAEANRNFHRQVLEKAVKAMAFQSLEERDYSALTLAVSKASLPELRKKIAEARRELNAFAEKSIEGKSPDEVYMLSLQFFRLTESDPTKGKQV
jgi:uncharacterized protein (TIGR02147 family)